MSILMRLLITVIAMVWLAAALARSAAQVPPDSGAAAAWQKLRKLQTTASVMHTTAHPDDEHGGVLAMLSRGRGARVALLTLTRGESGDSAIGSELFDALGLIRTEELLVSNRYYGVDQQYFGSVVDYGFSKRLEEAIEKWGKEHVLRDVVRVIRTERPFVMISRFQGNERDGHGNHSAAGLITKEAFDIAGDPTGFPEQLSAGLRPWQPLKLYIGGIRANEDWTIQVDAGEYDPVLGDSYQSFARLGLSFQRSQNSGRVSRHPGPALSYYKRLRSIVDAPPKEQTFFDGIDITIGGLYRALRKAPPTGAGDLLTAIEKHLQTARDTFAFNEPSLAAPALARALNATRRASTQLGNDHDVRFVLAAKEREIANALGAVLGISFTAMAQPVGSPEAVGPFGGGPPPMAAVIPGQSFEVRTAFVNPSARDVKNVRVELETAGKWKAGTPVASADVGRNQPLINKFSVTIPDDVALTRPYFSRASIQDTRYAIDDATQLHRPAAVPAIEAVVRYEVDGVPADIRRPVTRLEANLPYGHELRELAIVPAIALTLTPSHLIVPAVQPVRGGPPSIRLNVELLNNRDGASEGILKLGIPAGWKAKPGSIPFQFSRAGERALYSFDVSFPPLESRDYRVEAVAASGGREYREGYRTLRHRDLETRYLYREAISSVRGIDVRVAPGLKVGYVMGVGDDVPSGIAQLGVDVELLDEQDLATGNLARFTCIMTGTRAYAVREDLKTYNRRLLDYVRNGGNLIVLYNTQEFVPKLFAPYPAELPASAEEVSEEDSPVDILTAAAPVLNTPNRITKADFENWVEQRGSKFWTTWDPRYTALIATWDKNQPPQKGGWLHARYGKGHYTYFAYAFHRQLPYGVPGAYRLLANLLSLKPDK